MPSPSRIALLAIYTGLLLFAALAVGVMISFPGSSSPSLSICVSVAVVTVSAMHGRVDFWRYGLPEWRRLDRQEKKRAYKTAAYALGWRRWIPFLVVPFAIAPSQLTYPSSLVVYSAMILLFPLLFFFNNRDAIARACWGILAARGEPICTACGYNVTGNVSRRCPECGNETYRGGSAE